MLAFVADGADVADGVLLLLLLVDVFTEVGESGIIENRFRIPSSSLGLEDKDEAASMFPLVLLLLLLD